MRAKELHTPVEDDAVTKLRIKHGMKAIDSEGVKETN